MALFTAAEAKAFDKAQLASFDDADINAKAAEIKQWLEKVCGVNFEPTSHTETCDGDGSDWLLLQWPLVTSVDSLMIDGETVDAAYLDTDDYGSGMAIDSERGIITARGLSFTQGWSNVVVTYTAGYAAVPELVKRAALQIAVAEMPTSNVPMQAESWDDGGVSVSFMQGDGYGDNWHRLPDVRKAIRLYSRRLPGIA